MSIELSSFSEPVRAVIIGASGGIGHAFTEHLLAHDAVETVYGFARSEVRLGHEKLITGHIDFANEASIEAAVASVERPNLIIVATGMLHDGDAMQPEKALRDLSADKFAAAFAANTIGPALVAKHFLPLLPREARGVFAALSARVGSISDNHMGGWYGYRAAKAALNMVLKNASIEMGRRYKQAVIVGLHPGTVDTGLSKPFQGMVKPGKLFTPEHSTKCMLNVLNGLSAEHTGKCFDWAGDEVPA